MRKFTFMSVFIALLFAVSIPGVACGATVGKIQYPRCAAEDSEGILGEKYWKEWESEMPRIDADIEKYRKADAEIKLENPDPDAFVKIEQTKSAFFFRSACVVFQQSG